MEKLVARAYVDGSFNAKTKYLGSAVILFINQNYHPHRIAFKQKYATLYKYGANISEMNAVKTAIRAAKSLGVTDLTIYYDWSGLEFFSHVVNIKPRHLACQCYSQYAEFIECKRISMKINFIKVQAHTGIELNVAVDKMAKLASHA